MAAGQLLNFAEGRRGAESSVQRPRELPSDLGQKTGRIYPSELLTKLVGVGTQDSRWEGAPAATCGFSRKLPLFSNFRSSGTFMKNGKGTLP